MGSYKVGDLVWVRMGDGDHEEPATVTELGCETGEGEAGIKCKIQVSFFETVFEVNAVRAMASGRGSRRRGTSRALITPSPTPPTKKTVKKRKPDTKTVEETEKKKAKVSSPHFSGSSKTSPHFSDSESAEDEDQKPTRRRKAATKAVEEGKNKKPTGTKKKRGKNVVMEISSEEEEPVRKATKKQTGKKKAKSNAKLIMSVEPDSSSDDEALVTLKKKKVVVAKKKPAKKPAKKKTPPKKKVEVEIVPMVAGADSESDTDHPFKVEYSPNNRATCRRCDEIVTKGSLRISHVPLFRGKPGYRVYRHIKCAVFSEDVETAQDVGGWKRLSKEDYDILVDRVEESKAEIKKENEELDPDELVPVTFQGELRSAPPGLTANLLPFQEEGVSWMHHQEVGGETGCRGGILADEMGMGKTLQTIVTMLDNKPLLQHSKPGAKHPAKERDVRQAEEQLWSTALDAWKHEMDQNNVPKSILPKATAKRPGGGARAGTLIICPVIAITQWKAEIEKFTEGGTIKVGTYHGPNRDGEMPREMMCKYDVVLCTYQTLESSMRAMTSPNKVTCPNCGNKYKIDKLRIHLKYFCGEGAERTEAQSRQRRNREEGGGGGGGGGGGRRGSSQGKGKGKKTHSTKKKTMEAKKKPGIRIKKVSGYDSESDLSDTGVDITSNRRGSRNAAKAATKRMSSSAKEWGASTKGEDSDEFEEPESSSGDESTSADEKPKRKAPAKKFAKKAVDSSDSDSSDEEGGDDSADDPVARARQKQQDALSQISKKGTTKKFEAKKAPAKKGATKKAASKKGAKKKGAKKKPLSKGKKKKSNKSDDEDSDSSDDDRPVDPMEGIDMDALMQDAMEGSKMSPLHSFCWWRIVLDEAHMIKSRSSQTANAAFALVSIHRWCLSGTPLQNRVGEFYSLIRFLRIDPMAHYFCRAKGCNCKSLHYRMMNGRCQDCGHGSVQHYSHFNKHVLNPIQRAGYRGDGRRAMFTLKKEILDKSLLRRTKENRAADMKLPPRIVSIKTVRLHPVEEDFYNALYTQTQSSFGDYVNEGTLLNNYAHIFDLLMRMRQAVDHPYLVVYSKRDMKARAENGVVVANGSADCAICHESPTDVIVSSCCQGPFCRTCVQDYMSVDREGSIPCPGCQAPFSIDLNQRAADVVGSSSAKAAPSSDPMPTLKELTNVATGSILRRINLAEYATSSKIEALVEELVRMRETSPGSKAIVFSQFVNMLDLIRWRLHSDPCLKNMGLGAKALHGGMDIKARDASLKDFREDANVRVLLMSLKAGGVALNLTVANHIYLMDPWWNPAAEMQAIDRTHRLGQYRPIRAVRFIAEDTVEERILQLQEKKRLVFDGTIGRDAGSLKMLTVDDMKSLFA